MDLIAPSIGDAAGIGSLGLGFGNRGPARHAFRINADQTCLLTGNNRLGRPFGGRGFGVVSLCRLHDVGVKQIPHACQILIDLGLIAGIEASIGQFHIEPFAGLIDLAVIGGRLGNIHGVDVAGGCKLLTAAVLDHNVAVLNVELHPALIGVGLQLGERVLGLGRLHAGGFGVGLDVLGSNGGCGCLRGQIGG